MRNFMNKHDKQLELKDLNTIGIPIDILNKLKDSEIQALWSILNRFIRDIITSDDYPII